MSHQRVFVTRYENYVRSRAVETGCALGNDYLGRAMPETHENRLREATEDSAIPSYKNNQALIFKRAGKIKLRMYVDASFQTHRDTKGHSGFIIFIDEGSAGIMFKSKNSNVSQILQPRRNL